MHSPDGKKRGGDGAVILGGPLVMQNVSNQKIESTMQSIAETSVQVFDSLKSFESHLNDELVTHEHNYGFRGQANANWKLESTLVRYVDQIMRMFPERQETFELTHGIASAKLLKDFKKNLIASSDLPQDQVEKIDLWQYGQHFGLPSPLLDWTYSPYVALYFAIANKVTAPETGPCAIWIINLEILDMVNRSIVAQVRPAHSKTVSSEETLKELFPCVKVIDEPYEGNKRIVFQQGFFTKLEHSRSIETWVDRISQHLPQPRADRALLKKLVFPCSQKESMLMLDKLDRMNINGRTLFPDIFGTVKGTIDNATRWFQTPKYKTFHFSS